MLLKGKVKPTALMRQYHQLKSSDQVKQHSKINFAPRGQVPPAGEAISVIVDSPRQTDTRRHRRVAPALPSTSINNHTVHSWANDVEFLSSTCDHMPFVLT